MLSKRHTRKVRPETRDPQVEPGIRDPKILKWDPGPGNKWQIYEVLSDKSAMLVL